MELERVKGNTWVLKSWELIPLYQVDDTRCILLDTGTVDQRAELEAALDQAGLTPVAILGSHAHIDHMGSYGYFQKLGGRPGSDPGGKQLFLGMLQSVPGGLWAVPRLRVPLGLAPGAGGHPVRGDLRPGADAGAHGGSHLRADPDKRSMWGCQ